MTEEPLHATRLYAITPPKIDLKTFVPQVEQAFKGGDIGCLQLRLKDATDAEIIAACKEIAPICAAHEAAFILNDRYDLVDLCGADGVHVGQEDLERVSLKAIRKQLGKDAVIGVTCHASRHLAMEAGEATADYVAFGAFYPTTSKPKEKLEKWGTPGFELVEWWATHSILPQVSIGGITPKNLAPLVQAGTDFVAAITGIWDHPQGAQAGVAEYNKAIAEAMQG
jgi:thiamine-phosphate pyrophosphorylase